MKALRIIIILIAAALIGWGLFLGFRKHSEVVYTPQTDIQPESIKGCYVATLAKDVYTISVTGEEGENVSGNLSFQNFEKDSSKGTFTGTYKDDILLGEYTFASEGTNSTMQVIFKKTADGFVRGYGDTDSSGENFADLNNITYDGSYVFKPKADCTTSSSLLDTTNWKTFTDKVNKISFKYPATIGTIYISTTEWPPKLQIKNTPFNCAQAGQTTKQVVNGKNYCVTKSAEGAAGSTYTTYTYRAAVQNKTYVFAFTLRAVQCANYDDPQKSACEKERTSFNIDQIIDRIFSTVS